MIGDHLQHHAPPTISDAGSGSQPASSALADNAQQVATIDIAALAKLIQQQQQAGSQQAGSQQAGSQFKTQQGGFQNSKDSRQAQNQEAGLNHGQEAVGATDPQAMMEQIATLTKRLEAEKSKSKALQEEKKREMKGFLTGIRDYITNLDGVKDPEAKDKFMEVGFSLASSPPPSSFFV